MKKTLLLIGLLIMLVSACALVQEKSAEPVTEEFYERIPVIDGYYNGEKVWFIHPDVSNAEISEKLTRMISYKTLYVPQHAKAVDASKLAKLYVFTNGVDQKGVKPWGGGPFGYQLDIFDTIPDDEGYTSLRRPHLVTWNEDAKPRILKSEEALLEVEAAGELSIEETDFVVNVPILRWPGGSTRLKG